MSQSTTIDRVEIAERLGISVSHLSRLIGYTDLKMPEPIGKCGQYLIYDRAVMLAWIATKPLVGIRWKQAVKKHADPALNTDAVRLFLTGAVGTSQRQRDRNRKRRLAAQHAPRLTTRVHIDGCEHQTDPINYWKGLI